VNVVLSALLAWGVFDLHAQTLQTDELPADTLIVMQRGACEHRCAVYNVIIFADGSVIFDGRAYVRRAGMMRTNISRGAVRNLLDTARTIRFFDLKKRYTPGGADGCTSVRSDAPTAILSVSSAGRSNTVVHYHGCSGEDSTQLTQFEDKIDAAVNSGRWVK
jgi:hypothetical protein